MFTVFLQSARVSLCRKEGTRTEFGVYRPHGYLFMQILFKADINHRHCVPCRGVNTHPQPSLFTGQPAFLAAYTH